MRIANNGELVYCRWVEKSSGVNIRDVDPKTFFQQHMAPLRRDLLQGKQIQTCNECYRMDQHNKVSGRQRQLLKTGVRLAQFEKTMLSSPWYQTWKNNYSDGVTDQLPQDWQIDLGNQCNSACMFCSPIDSSRLATEWKKIGLISQLPEANWTDSPELIDKFIEVLKQSKHLQYLHFIGGETLINPTFIIILQALIDSGLNRTATIGFTTNLTVWDQKIVDLLRQFSSVNLGMSIEAFDPVNDYLRWPARIDSVVKVKDQWVDVARQENWLIQYRITPTLLSIPKLLSVYQEAWQHNISVESCIFLQNPACLRPTVLPREYREKYAAEMQTWISQFDFESSVVINGRNPVTNRNYLLQDLQSYVNYLTQSPDETHLLPSTVEFLKKIERNRNNSILDYLPEYEQLLRSAGY